MGRTVIVVEKSDGLFVTLLKGTAKLFYYIYVFPFVWLYKTFVKKPEPAMALAGAAPPMLAAPNIVVNVTAPAAAAPQVVVKEIVKIRCTHCSGLIDQGVPTCPECGAPSR